MIFRSIKISQFRQFRETVTITGLEDGLNVIAGDNEEGKSTILMAVRAAFFEKYKSNIGEHYRPYGQKVSPKVSVEFDLDGELYVLEKTFSTLKDGGCDLSCSDGGRWEGPHAEDYLQELLGFAYPGRGPTKSELQGLSGLLWVEQGHGYEEVTLNEGSRNRLHSVFDAEMTELLGGDGGEALYRKVEELRSEYFGKRDKPIGDYKTLNDELLERQDAFEVRESRLRDYDEKVELLENRKNRLRVFEEEQSIESASQTLKDAKANLDRVNELERSTETALARVQQAEIEERLPDREWKGRQALIEEEADAVIKSAAAEEKLKSSTAKLEPLKSTCEETKQELGQKKAERAIAQEALTTAAAVEQLRQAEATHRTQVENFDRAKTADQELRKCQAKRDQITLTSDDLDEILEIDRNLAINQEHLKTAATQLNYEIDKKANVILSGKRVEGRATIEITESTEIAIDGVGRFEIRPGGADLVNLQEQAADLEAQLNGMLDNFRVATVKEASRALRNAEKLDAEVRQHQAIVTALAADGLSVLEAQAKKSNILATRLREQVSQSSELGAAPDELQTTIANLNGEIEALKASFETKSGQYEDQKEQVIEQGADVRVTRERANDLRQELEESRKLDPDNKISKRIADATDTTKRSRAEWAAKQAALDNANPEVSNAEVDRAERVLAQFHAEYHDLKRNARDLEVELNALGQNGLAEELATAEVELSALQRQIGHMGSQAQALDLLYRTMGNSLQHAKETVARPIVEKMSPYLRQLIPGANPTINEDLVLTGLTREANDESFVDLSIGTREQLAVIIRLAYADLLTEKDVPVTVILDDALVNSDDDRRDRMKAILFQAARQYQILVLTCHAREYRDTGGHFVLLAEAKAQE